MRSRVMEFEREIHVVYFPTREVDVTEVTFSHAQIHTCGARFDVGLYVGRRWSS